MGKSIKGLTKTDWTISRDPSMEDLQVPALIRIAEASEVMARDRVQLDRDLKFYKDAYASKNKYIKELERSNPALRGVITKLRKQNA